MYQLGDGGFAPQSGAHGDDGLTLRHGIQVGRNGERCRAASLCSGSVINSGACEAICGIALSAEATVTRPAPARRAAHPAIDGAPVLPREPPITSTWPNVPLCPAGGRGASRSRNMAGSTSESQASS